MFEGSAYHLDPEHPATKPEHAQANTRARLVKELGSYFSPQAIFDSLEKLLKRNQPAESRHSIWDSVLIAQRLSRTLGEQSLADRHHEIRQSLTHDARHYAAECIVAEPVTTFEHTITLESASLTSGGYSEDLLAIATNFIDFLARTDHELSRGQLEQQIMCYVMTWAQETADTPDNYLLWTSPPDTEANGYHGADSLTNWNAREKHHSFIYLMGAEPTPNGRSIIISVRQLRAWPNMAQLIEIQSDFGQPPALDPALPVTHSLLANLIPLSLPEATLDQAQAYAQRIIYKKQTEWVYHSGMMPDVDRDVFHTVHTDLTEQFYLRHALPLLTQIPLGLTPEDPYWSSAECKAVVAQLDVIFDYYHLAHTSWVYAHNTNPEYQALVQTTLSPWQRARQHFFPEQPMALTLNQLNKLYDIHLKKLAKLEISAEDRTWYANTISPLSILMNNPISSLAQCGIVAPFTAPISALNQINTLAFTPPSGELPSLSFAERSRIKDLLARHHLIFHPGYPAYLVPLTYDPAECLPKLCRYEENGQEKTLFTLGGPCDYPLHLDTKYAVRLSPAELEQIMAYLADANGASGAEDERGEFQSVFDKIAQTTPAAELDTLHRKQKFLEKNVFKSSVDLNDWVTNNVTHDVVYNPLLGRDILVRLRQISESPKPYDALNEFFATLAQTPDLADTIPV